MVSTKFHEFYAQLAAPIPAAQIRQRQAPGGRMLDYITARTVMNRLDNVCGPEGWWDEYVPLEHSVICKLTIVQPDGTAVTKCDAGGYAGMSDQGDDEKSGFSDAFKRVAVKFGIGRELYNDGVADFVDGAPARESTPAYEGRQAPRRQPSQPQRMQGGQRQYDGQAPRSGKALFAFLKDQEQRRQVGLLKYINNWAKAQEFPDRIIDFDSDQTALAYSEAMKKLQAVGADREPGEDDDVSY